GLEAACASLTEVGDRVLVIDNGIFGEGFADFVTMYGGEAIFFKSSWRKGIDEEELKKFLEQDHQFKYATIVHCDTPTGVLNDLSKICPLLKKYGILTVVDSVAAMIGEPILLDEWQVDIALGGSQKAVSAPVGLTFMSISQEAWKAMENRKTPISGFYCNLTIWKDCIEKKWYPYSMPISDIKGLEVAVDNILAEGIENVWVRHKEVAEYVRRVGVEMGLKLYLEEDFATTVTAFEVDKAREVRKKILEKYNILIGGSLGELEERVIRIGHMGYNCFMNEVRITMEALKKCL
ncbi:MAG: pyridoxal-phosphate-dependent aminotransferase family protein, partial [Cellulosilyticaceae bacterium]